MVVILYTLISLYALWLFYLAVMNLYRAKKDKTISKIALVLGYPILIIGLFLDFVVNVTFMSILFLELPRELLVTRRLTRLISSGFSWRANLAYWICHHFLNAFDPSGDHCD